MSSVQARKLGDKYILLDRLGTGGMAEVYRGKLVGDRGFEKLIVIKKLLPHVAQDKEMVRLFIGEARLAALLQHENIAATYDFGKIDSTYFLAMEYLFGKDLYSILQRGKESNKPLGPAKALMITAKICEGMDYAHSMKDLKNNPLNLIHRDLTPQNIFITYDGKVKVIDFGVAKAEMLDTRTQAGVVKGKLSYMSPEQLSGASIDSRSDIFSIGILLYEMLSGRRMYSGDTAALIKKCITVDYTHLENILPDLPPKLYVILHKALSRDIKKRYQTCAEMQADIENLLFSQSIRPDHKVLKKYVQQLFAHEFKVEQEQATSVLENAQDAAPADQEKTVFIRPDGNEDVPDGDKTIVYDAYNDGAQCSSAVEVGAGGQGSKADIAGQPLRNKKLYMFLAASVVLVVFAGVLIRGFMKDEPGEISRVSVPVKQDTQVESASRQPVSEKVVVEKIVEKKLGKKEIAMQQKTIKELLLKAENAIAENRTTEPRGNSALGFYKDILRMDPQNETALVGLNRIGRQYVGQADKALAEKRFVDALNIVEAGLVAIPEHQDLLDMKKHLDVKKQTYIQELNNKAEQRLTLYQFMSPEDDSAYTYFNKVLEIEPDNSQALSGIQKIVERFVRLIRMAVMEKRFADAEEVVKDSLAAFPYHNGLQELKSLVEREKQAYFQKLCDTAERRLAADLLTSPKKDCALLYYNKILEIDPDNEKAKSGYIKIADRYLALANSDQRKLRISSAKVHVSKGLAVVPDHQGLLSLKKELQGSTADNILKGVEKNLDDVVGDVEKGLKGIFSD